MMFNEQIFDNTENIEKPKLVDFPTHKLSASNLQYLEALQESLSEDHGVKVLFYSPKMLLNALEHITINHLIPGAVKYAQENIERIRYEREYMRPQDSISEAL
jgi:hypothetical protein